MSVEDEASRRLSDRYEADGRKPNRDRVGRYGWVYSAAEVLSAVSAAVWGRQYYGPGGFAEKYQHNTPERIAADYAEFAEPTRDDLLDALTQVDKAREALDKDELRVIRAAREMGVEWEEIGEALGYPERSAKGSAQRRAGQLAKPSGRGPRVPRRRPLVAPVVTVVEPVEEGASS